MAVVRNHADGGGGIFSVPGSYVTINQSLIAHNSAYEAGGIRFDGGGELIDSTVTDNRLEPLPKKSYAQDPKLASTLANELSGYGGGIDFRGGNNLDIVNSTITDNHAIKGGGGLNSAQSYAAATSATSPGITLLLNTIVANNTSKAGGNNCNVEDNIIQSEGHNLASGRWKLFLTRGRRSARPQPAARRPRLQRRAHPDRSAPRRQSSRTAWGHPGLPRRRTSAASPGPAVRAASVPFSTAEPLVGARRRM